MPLSFIRRMTVAGLALLAFATAPAAQSAFDDTPQAQGMAYFSFFEAGAPTVEILMLGPGIRNGIYRLQEGTTLIETLALAGGSARSDSTERAITTSLIRVLRETDGQVQVVYEATPEELVRDRGAYPRLQTGDVIESEVQVEVLEVKKPFTFLDAVNVISRTASIVSLVLLLVSRL